MTKSTPSSLGVKHRRSGQQTDASQWTPRQAMSEPFAHVARHHLSGEMSPSHGNSRFPPKSLLQSNSVFPSPGLWEMGHWWWSTLSVGTTWRWPKTPAPVVAPVCRHTLHEARPRDYGPLVPPSQGPRLKQDHLLYPSFFSRVSTGLRDLSSELHIESCPLKGMPPFGGVNSRECERDLLLKEKKQKRERKRKRNYRCLLKHYYLMLEQLK